jgi:hypothetical protein
MFVNDESGRVRSPWSILYCCPKRSPGEFNGRHEKPASWQGIEYEIHALPAAILPSSSFEMSLYRIACPLDLQRTDDTREM